MPAIRRIFHESGLKAAQLGAIGVVIGPGSFTGVRVGLSAAKGLCEAGAVPMVAMSRLALIAGGVGENLGLLDAGRGEYFCGAYRDGVQISEALLGAAAARALMDGRSAVTCEARVSDALGVRLVAEPGAEEMLAMVNSRVASGQFADVATIDANYLRRTDAEILVHGR